MSNRKLGCAGLAIFALGLAWGIPNASAQEVEFLPGSAGLPLADQALKQVLERGQYVIIRVDTVLAADAVISGDVILIRATLRLEGRITGDVVGVQSDIFARPGGRIDGEVTVLGGGFYGSSLASLGGPPIDASRYDYRVEQREGGEYVITAPGGGAGVRLPGRYGFLLWDYDRVNALTIPWGIDFYHGNKLWLPNARLRIRYRSVRELVDGDLALEWPFGRHAVTLRGGRTVKTNDAWINGNLENSLYAFIAAVDTRNYYDARFAEATLRLDFGTTTQWTNDLTLGWERDRTLDNRDPFSLFESRGGFQDNLAVIDADVASLLLKSGAQFYGHQRYSLDVEASLDYADGEVAGDLSFTVLGASFLAEINTTGSQKLVLEGRGQAPLSTNAPPQRWHALGGWGSLPTLRPVAIAGDRMWWAAATYRVPFRIREGVGGRLVPWLQYAAGNAWSDDAARPSATHNLGVGLSVGPLAAAVYTAPGDDFHTVFVLGIDRYR
jgi:hypothetical protein